ERRLADLAEEPVCAARVGIARIVVDRTEPVAAIDSRGVDQSPGGIAADVVSAGRTEAGVVIVSSARLLPLVPECDHIDDAIGVATVRRAAQLECLGRPSVVETGVQRVYGDLRRQRHGADKAAAGVGS